MLSEEYIFFPTRILILSWQESGLPDSICIEKHEIENAKQTLQHGRYPQELELWSLKQPLFRFPEVGEIRISGT